MADDMGYSDIGPYGGEIHTPNLDRLAASGVRFSQMYNFARCCPSRAALLTGLYPHQAGVGHMTNFIPDAPGYQGFLNESCVTVAEVLRTCGYRTHISGKWHVGDVAGDPALPPEMRRGFDRIFGLGSGGNYFHRPELWNDDQPYVDDSEDFYLTDQIADHAVEMIDESAAADIPFFVYTAFTSPHWPLQALEEDIARYEGVYLGGWDATRTARHEELKGLGILDPKWQITARDEAVPAWADVAHGKWEALRMAVYAAQVDRMDQGIGRILDALDRNGVADNTLVMFLSDNGGCAEFLHEEGRREPDEIFAGLKTRDGRAVRVGNDPAIRPGAEDTYMSYDVQWANVSVTPFRRYKHWVHEGGISTPFIARWPARIKESRTVHSPAQIIDITATIIDVAGADYPTDFGGNEITPLEGESLIDAFDGGGWSRDKPMFWEHEGNSAVRMGQWKLVREQGFDWELFDMIEDRTELNDLSPANAGLVREMSGMYESWAARCGVLPWPPRIGGWSFTGMRRDGSWEMQTRHGHRL
ncbi:MAG: arylsulfatase [Chloroflexi bacterium]|nr:arylsulfatase [Chloroflexota bacterium]